MRKKFTLFIILLITSFTIVHAQSTTVKGKVSDNIGHPLVGVSVRANGTKNTSITDVNGGYSIKVPPNATLTFTYIGFAAQNVEVGSQDVINVTLTEKQNDLNEVVVVGYGSQKKSVVTGAISGVSAAQLENMPIDRVEQALEGRVSGVTIAQSSGSPGASSTVRIRGYSSFSGSANNDPLWVVDGVIVDSGGIGYLNEADIESIEVLKDAASAAIYGTRAANGVILVTTKKGKAGKVKVAYNGYYGSQSPAHKLDLLNATQYATIRNESVLNGGATTVPFPDPSQYGVGTDWQAQVFRYNSPEQNHQVSISGGSDNSTFYTSFGYLDQNGIVASPISDYKRINIRLNSTYKIAKWFTIGENLGYEYAKTQNNGGVSNTEFGGPLSDAINLDPITSPVETDPNVINKAPYNSPYAGKNAQGQYFGISPYVGQEISNPLAYIQAHLGNYNWEDNIVGNAFAELEPVKGLKIRSTLGTKMSFFGNENYTPFYYFSSSSIGNKTSFNRQMNTSLAYNLENTISYTKSIQKHNFTVLLGQGNYMDNDNKNTNVTFNNVIATNFNDANLQYKPVAADMIGNGSDGTEHTINSLFARVNYDYDEKYILTGIVRRDGSSNFGDNNKYGTFPSFSAGWVPSKESFWPKNDVVNFLKIRGGYGVTGNDQGIPAFAFQALVGGGYNYTFGTGNTSVIGFAPGAPPNANLKWEQTQQTDIGLEATLFNDFNFVADVFRKRTVGILETPPQPQYTGYTSGVPQNYGTSQNQGLEFELGYHKKVGDFHLGFDGNISFLQNKVIYIEPNVSFVEQQSASFQTMGNISRSTVGSEYNAFYGFQMLGIFQNQAQINNYVGPNGKPLQPNAKPGDVKWANLNGDNTIDANDRTNIGSPIPKFTYGLTFNLSYKNFDMVVFGNGVSGNDIFQGLRRLDIGTANYQTSILNSWTPTNPSNTVPRVTDNDVNKNYINFSKLYLESGDYFRIKTLQIGYTFPGTIAKKVGMDKLRVYIMSENLATITGYDGYDPEIGAGGAGAANVLGIDKGNYPQARTFMIGANVSF
jgi:TonB-linked SusC/RagA family outer membrane protein